MTNKNNVVRFDFKTSRNLSFNASDILYGYCIRTNDMAYTNVSFVSLDMLIAYIDNILVFIEYNHSEYMPIITETGGLYINGNWLQYIDTTILGHGLCDGCTIHDESYLTSISKRLEENNDSEILEYLHTNQTFPLTTENKLIADDNTVNIDPQLHKIPSKQMSNCFYIPQETVLDAKTVTDIRNNQSVINTLKSSVYSNSLSIDLPCGHPLHILLSEIVDSVDNDKNEKPIVHHNHNESDLLYALTNTIPSLVSNLLEDIKKSSDTTYNSLNHILDIDDSDVWAIESKRPKYSNVVKKEVVPPYINEFKYTMNLSDRDCVEITNGLYRHFKGGLVNVIGIAKHSETEEDMVIYQCKYDCRTGGYDSIWVRPVSMFLENVKSVDNDILVPRFQKVSIISGSKTYE